QTTLLAALVFLVAAWRSFLRAFFRVAIAMIVAIVAAAPVLYAWSFEGLPRPGAAPGPIELIRPGVPDSDVFLLGAFTPFARQPVAYASLVVLCLAFVGVGAALRSKH